MPKLSIITVNLNNAEGLRKTIESVVYQTFNDYEFIVVDGGSTDGSVDVIQQYANKITWWVSEPDKGIYHAMNKGILQAKGEYCQFLNSGDWIIDHHGLQLVFDKNPDEDICYCDVQNGKKKYVFADRLNLLTFFEGSISHQASFFKRSLFTTYGLYNEENKIVSDWEFYIKTIIISQCSYLHIPVLLIYCDVNGISWNSGNREILEGERTKVIKEYFPEMYEIYQQFRSLYNKNRHYHNSRLIQLIVKLQSSALYRRIRKIKNS